MILSPEMVLLFLKLREFGELLLTSSQRIWGDNPCLAAA